MTKNIEKILQVLKGIKGSITTSGLAEKTGIDLRNISRYTKQLEMEGAIERKTIQYGKIRTRNISLCSEDSKKVSGPKGEKMDKALDYALDYVDKFFQEKLYKYDVKAKQYIDNISEKYNISLYEAYESLWNYNSKHYNQEGQKIWNSGKRYVYINRSGGRAPFLCWYCEMNIKIEECILHHPQGYGFDHYDHIFSSAVIAHKECHKKGGVN